MLIPSFDQTHKRLPQVHAGANAFPVACCRGALIFHEVLWNEQFFPYCALIRCIAFVLFAWLHIDPYLSVFASHMQL